MYSSHFTYCIVLMPMENLCDKYFRVLLIHALLYSMHNNGHGFNHVEAMDTYCIIDPYHHHHHWCSMNVSQAYRTGFHFQPTRHWINDPNGPMYYKGIYHLFYQYNPKGVVPGNIEWAHSVSTDMINWKNLNPAIYPSKPFDKFGCWSGSATIRPGQKPIILYTGVLKPLPPPGVQVQNYAIPANYSDPYLQKWIKPDNNPILTAAPGENSTTFRDPTTAWLINGRWNILVGGESESTNRGGIAYLYKSKNFIRWTLVKHPLHSRAGTGTWECPDFYPVSLSGKNGLDTSVEGKNVKHVLKVSLDSTRYDYYTIGRYVPKKDRYTPDDPSIDGRNGLRYDYGNFYASKTFFDAGKNRRILWGWSNESDTVQEDVKKGWAGIQTVPRSIWLDPSRKQLLQWPIEEIETLRGQNVNLRNMKLHKGDRIEIKRITPAQADVDVTFSLPNLDKSEPSDPQWVGFDGEDVCSKKRSNVGGEIGPFGLLTLASKNLDEYTAIFFRVFKKKDGKFKVLLCADATRSSLDKKDYKPSFASFIDVDLIDKRLSLRTLIDHSVIESFGAQGKVCITSRVYPTIAVNKNAHLYAFNYGDQPVTIAKLDAWSMQNSRIN